MATQLADTDTVNEVPINHLDSVVRGRAADPEPIDLAWVRPWLGAWANCFRCKMCHSLCNVGYEVYFQWGDTARHTYLDEMCQTCLSNVCAASRNAKTSKYVIKSPASTQ